MARYWFKPKSFGYGATPVTWEAWALTIVGGSMAALGFIGFNAPGQLSLPDDMAARLACLLVATVALVALIVIARKTTDGEWRWRG